MKRRCLIVSFAIFSVAHLVLSVLWMIRAFKYYDVGYFGSSIAELFCAIASIMTLRGMLRGKNTY